uniref:Uncharacterized protein n=1 Tax=Lepeophtheirus salmonis TaxID=72036 RepID=A0A0K2TP22_LEPSM
MTNLIILRSKFSSYSKLIDACQLPATFFSPIRLLRQSKGRQYFLSKVTNKK